MKEKGKLLIISGFSGVGKGTIVNALLEKYNNYVISISATTRQPRNYETEGVHYFFKEKEEFEEMILHEHLLEYADYVGNYYGTPVEFVTSKLEQGINVILEIETQGALKVKEKMPEAKMIFILPPSAEELKNRLIGRGSETIEVINKRLKKAVDEIKYMSFYEYFVINDEIDNCITQIDNIVYNCDAKLPTMEEVKKIKEEISNFSKGE